MALPLIIMFPSGWTGKVNFTALLREQGVKPSQGNVMMQRTWVKFIICRKKKTLFSFVLWQWGQSSIHLALNQIHWVSVGDREGAPCCLSPGTRSGSDMYIWASVGGGVDTGARCTSLSWLWEYVCVGQVHQDPSINWAQIRPAPLLTRG